MVQLIDGASGRAVMKERRDFDGREAILAASRALAVLPGRRAAGPQPRNKAREDRQK
jgi:hypothetical protein